MLLNYDTQPRFSTIVFMPGSQPCFSTMLLKDNVSLSGINVDGDPK
jgi:hypothetical protein